MQPTALDESLIDKVKISVVVSVCRGGASLEDLIDSIIPFALDTTKIIGQRWSIGEVLLVHDSDDPSVERMVEAVSMKHSFVRPLWLTKRFGCNAALLAGMAGTVGDWVLTLDDTGRFNSDDVTQMMDRAIEQGYPLVYGMPLDGSGPGGVSFFFQRFFLGLLKIFFGKSVLFDRSSCRVVRGDVARSLAAYCNGGVDLDVAMRWVVSRIGLCSVGMGSCPEGAWIGLSLINILSLDNGLMRRVLWLGFSSVILGLFFSIAALTGLLSLTLSLGLWWWVIAAIFFFSGLILLVLGTLGQCVCVSMSHAMGKPLYVVASKPTYSRLAPK